MSRGRRRETSKPVEGKEHKTNLRDSMRESTAGNYNFEAKLWRTSDSCHNIDFLGALDAGYGYCCGTLPCDFTA